MFDPVAPGIYPLVKDPPIFAVQVACVASDGKEYPDAKHNASVPDVVTGDPDTENPVGAESATLETVPPPLV